MRWKPIDCHCHLDLYPDHVNAFRASESDGVRVLAVTTTPRAWPENCKLAKRGRLIHVALGLHPQLVNDGDQEIALWEKYLPEARFIGEVGLDAGPRFFRTIDRQKRVFEHILKRCADAGGKIASVHSTRCVRLVLDMISRFLPTERGRVILHWFTGSLEEAKGAVKLGCYFSVNSEMLKNERQKRVVLAMPIDRLLTETDGPFIGSGVNAIWPRDVSKTVADLACLRGIGHDEMGERIEKNFSELEDSV